MLVVAQWLAHLAMELGVTGSPLPALAETILFSTIAAFGPL